MPPYELLILSPNQIFILHLLALYYSSRAVRFRRAFYALYHTFCLAPVYRTTFCVKNIHCETPLSRYVVNHLRHATGIPLNALFLWYSMEHLDLQGNRSSKKKR